MRADSDPSGGFAAASTLSLEERLERGEIIYYPVCPIPLPQGAEQTFLLQQRLGSALHKNISWNPHTGQVSGFARQSAEQARCLRDLLAAFSRHATDWLAGQLPRYRPAWQLDRATLRPEEEATRKLRQTARNDLLHIDAFPSRPTQGRRILRLFVNVHETEPRVWVTADDFASLLERYGREVGLPTAQGPTWVRQLGGEVLRLFRPGQPRRSVYDAFMLRFHHFLKAHDDFQERASRRFWKFPPGSAWLMFTDGLSHAELRGRYALEHSWFIAPETLARPEASPAALLRQACGVPVLERAA